MHGHPCCPGESSCTNRSATLSLPIDGAGGVARAGPPAAAALRATCGSIGTWQKGRNGRPAYAIATSFSSMKYPVRSYGRPAYSSALAGALRRRHGCASDDNVRTRNATLHSRRRVGFLTLIQSAGPIDTAGRSAWRRYLRGSWRTHSETMPHHLRYQCGRTVGCQDQRRATGSPTSTKRSTPLKMPHNAGFGTPMIQSPVPITKPNAVFSPTWNRNSLLRRRAPSSSAAVVFWRS
jgi:hypothetical protein